MTAEHDWVSCSRLAALPAMSWGDAPGHVVVVAPHPDDETLALGGTLYGFAERGRAVTVVAVTDGEASHPRSQTVTPGALGERRAEERRVALSRLGLHSDVIVQLREPDGKVASSSALDDRIAEHLRGAAWCLAPWRRDGHPDHDAAGEAAARAAARTGVPFAEYLVWAWQWARPNSDDLPWQRARRISFGPEVQRAKANAIAAYMSQIAPLSDKPGDEVVISEEMLAYFQRGFEVVLV